MAWKPDYAEVDGAGGLRDFLQIDSHDDDAFLALWATAASRNVDGFCGRQFGTVDEAVARVYSDPVWDRKLSRWVYTIDDLYDLTDLSVVDDAGDAVTGLEFEPVNALADGKVYERMLSPVCGRVTMLTDRWGWPEIPPSITTGMLLMAARVNARRGAPFGTAGSPSEGSEMRLLAKLDPDMMVVLRGGGFRRSWWAS